MQEGRKIGITGGIAAGKSLVTAYLRSMGYPVIDLDVLTREFSEPEQPGWKAIRDAFGEDYFIDGLLDRKKLGDLVFQDNEALLRLNAVMHPLLMEETFRRASTYEGAPVVFIDAALIWEAEMDRQLDQIWLVEADTQTRLRRLMERNGLTEQEASIRIAAQTSRDQKYRCPVFRIDNSADKSHTYEQIEMLLKQNDLWSQGERS